MVAPNAELPLDASGRVACRNHAAASRFCEPLKLDVDSDMSRPAVWRASPAVEQRIPARIDARRRTTGQNRRLTRATVKSSLVKLSSSPVRTCRMPTSCAPAWPVILVPKSIFCGVPRRAQADAPAEEGDDLIVVVPAAAEEPALAVAAEIEEGGAVEEEIAALGKEQRKARQVDLPLIDFRLREVGVDGEHGAQQRGGAVEEIDSRARVARRSRSCRAPATPPT